MDLIVVVHPRSGGQGGSVAWGRRGSPGTQAPRRRFAGENQIGVPVADSGRGLALEPARDMRNPLEVDSRGCRVRSVVQGDEGSSGR